MKYYNIQAVSQISGLSSHCIRAWEKRYNAITPERADNGRRVYSEAEVQRLVKLAKLSMMGNSISLIANLSDSELETLLQKMGQRNVPTKSTSLVDPKSYQNNLFMALAAYKLDILTHELNKASMDLSCKDFAEVVAGLLRKVGEYVAHGRMSIAQEHTLSALTKFFIGRRISQFYRSDSTKQVKFTLATPPGEMHSIGILLSALLMVENNVDFIYLGEDLPVESIAEAAIATNSDYVLLGISPAYQRIRDINDVAKKLNESLNGKASLWIGGAIEQLNMSTIREAQITTFGDLSAFNDRLAQLVEGD